MAYCAIELCRNDRDASLVESVPCHVDNHLIMQQAPTWPRAFTFTVLSGTISNTTNLGRYARTPLPGTDLEISSEARACRWL